MKRPLLILCIIAILVSGFALYRLFGSDNKATTTEQVEQVSVEGVGTLEDRKPFSGVGTLADLQARKENLECQIIMERSGEEGNIEGTSFTSNGNLRGDFMVPAPEFGGKIVSSMIVGGPSMYVWTKIGTDTFGFKSDVTTAKNQEIDTKEPVALDADVKYTCAEWAVVDGSVFVPPANVQFKDLNAIVEAGMEYGTVEGEF